MSSQRIYYALIALVVVVIVGIFGGAYGINALLEKQSSKLVGTKAKLASLNQEQTELVRSKKDIATYTNLYDISKVIVPENKNQAETVRQITKLAAANGITLVSINFPESSLGSGVVNTGTSSTSAPSTAPSAAPSPASNPKLSQLKAVPKIAGVYDLQLVVASSSDTNKLATYPQLINFLSALEQNRLTALVSKLAISPQVQYAPPTSSKFQDLFSFTLTLDIYIKP